MEAHERQSYWVHMTLHEPIVVQNTLDLKEPVQRFPPAAEYQQQPQPQPPLPQQQQQGRQHKGRQQQQQLGRQQQPAEHGSLFAN